MYGRVQTRLPLPAPAANRWCTSRALPLSPRPKALRAVETKPTGRTRGGVDRRNSVAFPRRDTCGIDSVANQEPLRACVHRQALLASFVACLCLCLTSATRRPQVALAARPTELAAGFSGAGGALPGTGAVRREAEQMAPAARQPRSWWEPGGS